MLSIDKILAREILDSRGHPTVEVDVYLTTGAFGRASVPSGASRGEKEALELRDDDQLRYLGKGVQKALQNMTEVMAPSLRGKKFKTQEELDKYLIELDGTPNKSRLGANAILGVSVAFLRASLSDREIPLYRYLGESFSLPVPLMNIINGGVHADNGLDIQEFMIIPVGKPTFREALRAGSEIFQHLKKLLKKDHYSTSVGDEGGFAPHLASHEEALDFIVEAIDLAGYRPGKDIFLGLDVAASEFYKEGRYVLSSHDKERLTSFDLISYYVDLVEKYPILSIEDGLSEKDWSGWKKLTEQLGDRIQLVGDDIFVTHAQLLKQGIEEKIGNAILIKLNQIGTVSEALTAVRMAQEARFGTVMSHRSGETEDYWIADFAVAWGCRQIKTGSLSRSDRLAKYNQLLRIEEQLGSQGRYWGPKAFPQFSL